MRPERALIAKTGGVQLTRAAGRDTRPVQDAQKHAHKVRRTAARTQLPALIEGSCVAGPGDLIEAEQTHWKVVAAFADLLSHDDLSV